MKTNKQIKKIIETIYPNKTSVNQANVYLEKEDLMLTLTLFIYPRNGNYMFATINPGYMPKSEEKGGKPKSVAALRLNYPFVENFGLWKPGISSPPKHQDRDEDEEVKNEDEIPSVTNWNATQQSADQSISP